MATVVLFSTLNYMLAVLTWHRIASEDVKFCFCTHQSYQFNVETHPFFPLILPLVVFSISKRHIYTPIHLHAHTHLDWFIGAAGCWTALWDSVRWCWLSMFNKHVSIGSSGSFDNDYRRWPIGELFLWCIPVGMAAGIVAYMDTPEISVFDTALFMEY